MSSASTSLHATHLSCSLTCKDLAASITFYRDAIGFDVVNTWEREGRVVSAVVAAAARIRAAGGSTIDEPADRPWGTRMFQFRDPDGFKFGISTPLA